ncbi:MAG TPA: hypothetical protein VK502_01025 [Candidatus Saccharimonadales bacterium]|nr:hypothetical protein [Candidatus Saccharimonadales bacterium]
MIHETQEKIDTFPDVSTQFGELIALKPKPVACYVPTNKVEQQEAFLSGKIRNPDHVYAKLDDIDFDERLSVIRQVGNEISSNPNLNPKHAAAYEEFVDVYVKKTRLMQLAHDYKVAQDPLEKEYIAQEYKNLNIELYGEPDKATYRSFLQEKLNDIAKKQLTGQAALLRNELFAMADFDDSRETIERFKPSDETVEWMHGVANTLYGGMLSHVPEQEEFSETEVQCIFQEIIREEFGEAADGWTVDVEPARSITVKASEKRIVIPDDRGEVTREELQDLVGHEIGVHMLRAIIGGETDLDLLKDGLSDYEGAEEGLGKVMGQALAGEFAEAGADHYITVGAKYFDRKDFRDIFELKWRLEALYSMEDGEELTEEATKKARNVGYGNTLRILRGTDELAWLKDLSYYNGSVDMWRHLEEIRGDDVKFMFVLMGKSNPANSAHERVMYETATP